MKHYLTLFLKPKSCKAEKEKIYRKKNHNWITRTREMFKTSYFYLAPFVNFLTFGFQLFRYNAKVELLALFTLFSKFLSHGRNIK